MSMSMTISERCNQFREDTSNHFVDLIEKISDQPKLGAYKAFEKINPSPCRIFLKEQENVTRDVFDSLIGIGRRSNSEVGENRPNLCSRGVTALVNVGKHTIAAIIDTLYHTILILPLAGFILYKTALLIRTVALCAIGQNNRADFNKSCEKWVKYAHIFLSNINLLPRSILRITPVLGPYLGFTFDAIEITILDGARALKDRCNPPVEQSISDGEEY